MCGFVIVVGICETEAVIASNRVVQSSQRVANIQILAAQVALVGEDATSVLNV